MITVYYFAQLREITNTKEEHFDFAGLTVTAVKKKLTEKYPELLLDNTMFAINEEFVSATSVLSDGDKLVFIPPVSGG